MNAVKSILLFGAIVSLQAFAKDIDLRCTASSNTQVVFDRSLRLVSGTRGLFIGKAAGLDFILTHSGENQVELQAFNVFEPSRTYATAIISEAGSFVDLSIWKREFVVEARCTAF